jgi:glycogen synthase
MVGGLGKHVADLAPALAQQGIDVHIITPNLSDGAEEEQVAERVTVHRVSLNGAMPVQQSLVAFNQIGNNTIERKAHELHGALGGFDLIHGHDWLVAYSSVALKYALKLPLVVTVHSMERGRMQGNLSNQQSMAINGTEWWLTNEALRVITVSNFMAQQVHTYFDVPREKLDVIYNGVAQPATPEIKDEERASFRAAFANPDELITYYVGRIVHEKGVQVLVDAAPRILRQFPRVKFVVAGTGAYLAALRERAQQLGVADRFVFTGFITDDVRDKLYQVADVAVFPSLYEPFGIVALEAMMYGCPVVAAQTGGLAEFVRPHETGILVTPGNPESLAWGIMHTLQHPDWTARRVANARTEVQQVYNWTRVAEQTAITYRRTHEDWLRSGWAR